MQTRSTTREIPTLELRAAVVPKTVDIEKRTVQVTWTTGARVLRGYFEPFWEELSLDPKHVRMKRLQNGAPLLDSHLSYELRNVLGVTETAELEAKKGTATVRFDKGVEGEEAFRKVVDGILRSISVGYRIYKMEKVEGGEGKVPVYRAVDWEPYELSLVAVGADAGAVTRSEHRINVCEFIEELRTMADDAETPTAAGVQAGTTAGTAGTAGTAATAAPKSADAAAASAIRAAEQERMLGIQRVARALKRPDAEADAAIKAGTSLADYRAAAQDAFADSETITVDKRDPRIQPGEDSRDKWLRGASAWLMQRAAVAGVIGDDAKKRGEKAELDPGEFRGLRMVDLARQALERSGVRTAGMLPMDVIGQALTQRSSGGMASTGDFPVLLENTLHKVLLASYGTTPDTWSQFCSVGSVSDFRPHKRYRLGTFAQLSALNELGEFTNKAIPDGVKESISAGTKGNIIAISRQALINDDLSAFSSLATMLGRAARLSIEVDVYALLASNSGLGPTMNDGQTLFHATHNNIGTGAALSVASLDADRVVMAQQKDPSGNEYLDLRPAIMVLPVGLGGAARVINQAQYDVDVSNKFQIPNKVVGLFRTIVDTPRLSGTRRYMFADPSIAPTIEVVFLDGQQQPFMDINQPWRVDGVEWKVRLDYGVGGVDFRGATTNAGA